jgi:DNA-binding IclR family transcriptional regulator
MDKRLSYLRHAAIYCYVMLNPGCRKIEIASALGWHRSEISRLLVTMEYRGLLLYSDDQRRLYTFDN